MYFLGGEKTMANEVALKKKQEEVKELADKFKTAKIVLLTDYRGIKRNRCYKPKK